jgi:hypothetical protein
MGLAGPDAVRIKFPERHLPYVDDILPLIERVVAAALPREVCEACGCLCKPDERCPGCVSNAVMIERLREESAEA